jgi:hypothetical protein
MSSSEFVIIKWMKTIARGFVQAQLPGMCLYGSVLLKEQLAREGIEMILVAGYLQTDRGEGELYRHVWLEDGKGHIYDIGWLILSDLTTSVHQCNVRHHRKLPSITLRTDLQTPDQVEIAHALEHGIGVYMRDAYEFWSEFDGCEKVEMKKVGPVINKIRDSFLD